MSSHNTYCIFCAGPQTSILIENNSVSENIQLNNETVNYDKFHNHVKWFDKFVILTEDDEILTGYKDAFGYKNFQKENHDEIDITDNENTFLVHVDCMKFIKSQLNLKKIVSSNFDVGTNDDEELLKFIDYGGIEKYAWREFDINKCVKDNNTWMLISPLYDSVDGKRNGKRILNAAKQVLSKQILNKTISPEQMNSLMQVDRLELLTLIDEILLNKTQKVGSKKNKNRFF